VGPIKSLDKLVNISAGGVMLDIPTEVATATAGIDENLTRRNGLFSQA
jgi:hypothetical protein